MTKKTFRSGLLREQVHEGVPVGDAYKGGGAQSRVREGIYHIKTMA